MTVAGCRLEALVGHGGSSEVWLAVDRANGRRVAVKLLAAPPQVGDRLRVRHPHLVAVQRICEDPPAVIMDFAAGGSVAGLVAVRGPLDAGEVVTVLVALAGALADLHRGGVVHGDVSGSNVLLDADGRPLLGDLGALRIAGAGPVMVTDGYAPPESATGVPGGPAGDVHALCAVAWLCLTGDAPAPGPSRAPLSVLAAQTPAALVDLISRGVDPDPARRPSPSEIVETVISASPAAPIRMVAAAMPAVPAPEAVTHRLREWSTEASRAVSPPAQSQVGRLRRPRARRRHLGGTRRVAVVTAVGVTLGVLAAGGVLAWDRFDAPAVVRGGGEPLGTTAQHVRPEAPGEDEIVAVTRALVAVRTTALRSADATALAAVYVPGSPAGAADIDFISGVITDGVAAEVSVSLGAMRVEEVTADSAAVVVEMATVLGAESAEVTPQPVRIELVTTSQGWRIADVGAAGPA